MVPESVTRALARSRLVFGTAPLASGFWGNDETTAIAAAREGLAAGLRWFDTAPL